MIQRLAPIFIGVFFVLILLLPFSAIAQFKQVSPLYDCFTNCGIESKKQSSPAEALGKVVSVLMAQSSDLKKSLLSLKDLSDEEGELRFQYLQFLEGLSDYYESLKVSARETSVSVQELALAIKGKRGESSPQLKAIGDFVLVFQARGALKTANNRFAKINADLERLEDLKILQKEKTEFLLNQVLLSLTSAGEAIGKAEELLATTTEAHSEIRNLVNIGIGKIKLAYKKFLEISNLLKEALK